MNDENTLIYLCATEEGPVGWVKTADEAVWWSMQLRDNAPVRITKLYEMKGYSTERPNTRQP